MKKLFLILSVLLTIFTSCETEFDVHAEWEEVTVVYGLLNQNQDRQYVKINKAYLGPGDALQMAQIADSINFNPEAMDVRLYKLQGIDTIDFINLDTTIIIKDLLDVNGDLGTFSVDNNIIYTTLEEDSGFLEVDKAYAITIENNESGNFVSAKTQLINNVGDNGPLQPVDFFYSLLPPYTFAFYNPNQVDSAKFLSKKIKWRQAANGQIYQLEIRFNYKENNINKFLIWRQPTLSPLVGSATMSTTLWGDNFFTFLSNNIENNSSVFREFVSLDLIMTIGTSNLVNYIAANEPYEGLVQERPVYTNVDNGFGLFSARLTYELIGINLSDDTKDYLKEDLQRNFQ